MRYQLGESVVEKRKDARDRQGLNEGCEVGAPLERAGEEDERGWRVELEFLVCSTRRCFPPAAVDPREEK